MKIEGWVVGLALSVSLVATCFVSSWLGAPTWVSVSSLAAAWVVLIWYGAAA